MLVVAACYHPSAATGVPCGPGDACPVGQHCDTSQAPAVCVAQLADGGAAVDGPWSPDAAACGACGGTTPICDGGACRACRADAECAPGVCTEYNGTCVPPGQAVYVARGGSDAGACTHDAPCQTFAYALGQVSATRAVIAVAAGTYSVAGAPVLEMSPTVPLLVISGPELAPQGTTLTSVASALGTPVVVKLVSGTAIVEGVVIQDGPNAGVRDDGQLTLSHVVVADGAADGVLATPSTAPGITSVLHVWDSIIEGNVGLGIDAQRGGIEVLRSLIATNRGGGISVQGAATITSSMVVRNGTANSTIGGIEIQKVFSEPVSITFDTIADNQMRSTGPAGLGTDGPITVDDVIYAGNTSGSAGDAQDVFCSGCMATYSVFGANAPASGGNVTADPAFVNPAILDYHITQASPARNAADPAATLGYDVDGEARPQGVARDIGADEIP